MTAKSILKEKDLMVSQIKKYSPIFKPFFESELTLEEYSRTVYDFKKNQVYIDRQKLVKEEILNKFRKLFGPDAESRLKINFPPQLAINIVDHHQVLNHPLLIGDNVIANIDKFFQEEKQDAIVVISSGDVPPNNYFSKNGFQLHDKKVPIFSNSERELSSYYIAKRDFNFVEKLKQSKRWNEFDQVEQDFLTKEFEIIKSLDFSSCQDYKDQVAIIIQNSWPRMFEENFRQTLPDLLYITQEELTTSCLLKILKQDNFVSQALFNKTFREKIIEAFRGIVVTWNEKEEKGTHFFWRKHPTEDRSLRMYLVGDVLVPTDQRYQDLSVKLDKETILGLLEKKEIYPSLFLIFATLNFYFGIKPLVGQGSIIYLNLIRDKWIEVLKNSDFSDEVNNMKSYEIDKMIAGIGLFFDKSEEGVKNLYAYDILYQNGITEKHLDSVFKIKFKDLLEISAPGIYDYVSQKYIPDSEKIKPKINSDMLANLIIK